MGEEGYVQGDLGSGSQQTIIKVHCVYTGLDIDGLSDIVCNSREDTHWPECFLWCHSCAHVAETRKAKKAFSAVQNHCLAIQNTCRDGPQLLKLEMICSVVEQIECPIIHWSRSIIDIVMHSIYVLQLKHSSHLGIHNPVLHTSALTYKGHLAASRYNYKVDPSVGRRANEQILTILLPFGSLEIRLEPDQLRNRRS